MDFTEESVKNMTTHQLKNHHRYINNVLGNAKHLKINVLFPDNFKDKKNSWSSILNTTPEVQEELRQVVIKAYKQQKEIIRKEWAIKEEAERAEFYKNNNNKALVWKNLQITSD